MTYVCIIGKICLSMYQYYFYKLIFQEGVLTWSTKAGLETKFPTIAEKLKDVGYATHMLGK